MLFREHGFWQLIFHFSLVLHTIRSRLKNNIQTSYPIRLRLTDKSTKIELMAFSYTPKRMKCFSQKYVVVKPKLNENCIQFMVTSNLPTLFIEFSSKIRL